MFNFKPKIYLHAGKFLGWSFGWVRHELTNEKGLKAIPVRLKHTTNIQTWKWSWYGPPKLNCLDLRLSLFGFLGIGLWFHHLYLRLHFDQISQSGHSIVQVFHMQLDCILFGLANIFSRGWHQLLEGNLTWGILWSWVVKLLENGQKVWLFMILEEVKNHDPLLEVIFQPHRLSGSPKLTCLLPLYPLLLQHPLQ